MESSTGLSNGSMLIQCHQIFLCPLQGQRNHYCSAPVLSLYFYCGVLHPVARILSKLLEEQFLATTFQGVYFTFYIFAATWFGPYWPSSGGIHNYYHYLYVGMYLQDETQSESMKWQWKVH
jgi:hypothetical protein